MIFSRTISLYLISIFSKIKSNKKIFLEIIKNNEKKIFVYSSLVFLIYLFISIFILIFYNNYQLELLLSFIFISLFFLTNNLTILMSSLLIVNEQSSKSFFVNLCTFLIFGIFIFYSSFFHELEDFIIICFGLFIAGLIRWLLLKLLLRKEYA
jgi:O-antigen/teichoic acid export membrane protein